MKHIFPLALLLAAGLVLACSGKKEEAHDHEHDHDHGHEVSQDTWKEMDDFHMVMAEAFHPYKDSSNLEPAKKSATVLAEMAVKWSASPIPEKVKSDSLKTKLDQLNADAASFEGIVKAGDDKQIAEHLTKLHDLFHEIQEDWYGGKEGHHHHH